MSQDLQLMMNMEDKLCEKDEIQQCPTPHHETDRIDPDGDVELILPRPDSSTHHHLIVSSKVLSLASPVFRALFSPHFHEGSTLADAKLPHPIELEEDHSVAMSVICNILHHQLGNIPREPELTLLFAIAESTDKWNCIEPLRLWGETWLRDWRRLVDHPSDMWSVLLAAYKFDNFQAFSEVTSQVVKSFPRNSDDLFTHIAENSFPPNFMVDLCGQMETISAAINHEIELAVVTLQDYKKAYPMWKKVCGSCGKTLPEQAKRCHPCDNTEFGILFCNTDSRIALYFETLRKVGLWPLQDAISASCIDQIVAKLATMAQLCPHTCESYDQCPVKLVIANLIKTVRQKQKSASGLCLDCLRQQQPSRRDMGSAGQGCRVPHQAS